MTVLASAIINRVRTQVIDLGLSGLQRWSDTELLEWISDGQRTIVANAPRASAAVVLFQLTPGTRQVLPANAYTYLRAYRNMGTNGTTPGAALVPVDRTLMDTQYPQWHAAAQVAAPAVVVFDPSDQAAFYVSPPADGTGQIELLYSVEPVDLTVTTAPIVLDDIYQTPLFDYTMYRACQKDSDYAPGQAAAKTYLDAFTGFLGGYMKDAMTSATQEGQT